MTVSPPTDARLEQLHHIDNRLLGYAVLVLAGIGSSLLARRFGAPLLLVFLILGLLLGVDGPGGIRYDDAGFTYQIGALALCLILFDGGLQTHASQVRGAIRPALVLATIGVLVTASLTAAAAHVLLELPMLQSLLLGTVLASTDAAAVFFLIRARGLHLERRTASTLEIESGANDPMAVFLTVALSGWIAGNGHGSVAAIALHVVWAMGCGAVMGYGGGRLIVAALNRYDFPSGLHPWLAMSGAVTLFALTNLIGGSGYLAVYAAGVIVANRPVRARSEVSSVQDAATWFAQLVMFLLLGLLATPHALLNVMWPALGVAAFLMFIARPAAALLCLLPFRYRWGEIGFISWVGLRGAVSIFLASIPLLAQLPNAWLYFNVAFVVVLASLVIQGWTLERAAHAFGVAVPRNDPDTRRVHLDLPGQLDYELLGYRVAPGARALTTASWPLDVRIAMVVREGRILQGSEIDGLRSGDYAYMLAPTTSARRLDWYFAGRGAESGIASQPGFGEFQFGGNAPLGEIAEFYGLHLPKRFARHTAARLFDERFDEQPQPGDQLSIGNAILTVHRLDGERVAQVGLRLIPLSERLLKGS
ncbi:MAG: potassium/proton antiporter [Proteobacteria bacterium]|nr:potassium/proton antiporter [Pseudomonadota bacterium]